VSARLFVLSGRQAGHSFDVADGAVLGRSPECDVCLLDRSVSRRHARLERAGAGWRLVDLGSRNGLRRNGARVESAPLEDFDEVQVGELTLRFRAPDAAEAPAPADAGAAPSAARREPSAASAPPPPAASRPGPRSVRDAVQPEDEGEIELEEDIVLAPAGGAPRAPRAVTPAPPSTLSDRDARRAELLRDARGGLFSGDLSQAPLWVRALVTLLVLGLGAGFFWAAFEGVRYLRAG
jgi:predicted component of type VI protein secretion system